MILIAAIDDGGGMMFNKRRQSRDGELVSRILKLRGEKRLWVNAYTAGMFKPGDVTVDENFLLDAPAGDYCFTENVSAAPYEKKTEMIVLFGWNRRYPADFYFDIDLAAWKLKESENFPGSSHERITMEVYER